MQYVRVIISKLDVCRISSVFSTYRILVYIILLLLLVKIIIFIHQSTSDSRSLTSNGMMPDSHDTLEMRNFVCDAFHTPIITDASGEYRIVKLPFRQTHISVGDTTLISQCSVSHLYHFLDLHFAWDGPISLTVFVESSKSLFIVTNYLLEVRLCLPHALTEVTIQLVMPLLYAADCRTVLANVSCSNFLPASDMYRFGMRNYDSIVDYPNNLLRNVAIDAAISDYIFVVDIDMIPSSGLYNQLSEFIDKEPSGGKIAFVVPVFEMKLGSEMPVNRAALLQMWNCGIIRPFYRNICWKCQRYTDYDKWHNLTLKSEREINVAYIAEWHDPWEPFYIVDQQAPKYDENFKSYGFNRISQVCHVNICFVTIEYSLVKSNMSKATTSECGTVYDNEMFLWLAFMSISQALYQNFPLHQLS